MYFVSLLSLLICCPQANLLKNCPIALFFFLNFVSFKTFLSWKTIGIGEVHHGLYLLQRSDYASPSSLSDHLIKHKLGSSSHFVKLLVACLEFGTLG